ncbi:N-acetyltransferase [Rufibacter sediminis]
MRIIEASALSHRLWNQEYPEKLCYHEMEEFESYLSGVQAQRHFLLVDEVEEVHGWGVTFEREVEKWFAIILDNKLHGLGYGALLLKQLQEKEDSLCGWVIDHARDLKRNGETYSSPLAFYLKNGFRVLPGVRLETEKISAVKVEWSPREIDAARWQ